MESLLAQYSLDEIQHLGQVLGGIIVSVLVLSFAFVAYKLIKRALYAVDGFHDRPDDGTYGQYNDWG